MNTPDSAADADAPGVVQPGNSDSVRTREERFVVRCSSVACGDGRGPNDRLEASVMRIAAVLLEPKYPAASTRLRVAWKEYFAATGTTALSVEQAIHDAGIRSLSWLRNELERSFDQLCKSAPIGEDDA